MPLVAHPRGNYLFLPGISPYSCGVVSAPGFEIAHVTFHRPIPYRQVFGVIEHHLHELRRPRAALCGIELRSPWPFSFQGFEEFNAGYTKILQDWGLFVEGVNPVARTNVAPEVDPPTEPVLYGFSYSRPCELSLPQTFIVSGAGELPEGVLEPGAIARSGDTSPEAMKEKASFVMDLMEQRLQGMGTSWSGVTAVNVYTVHPLESILREVILPRLGPAVVHGIRWFLSRPPIVGIEYEMDLRGRYARDPEPRKQILSTIRTSHLYEEVTRG